MSSSLLPLEMENLYSFPTSIFCIGLIFGKKQLKLLLLLALEYIGLVNDMCCYVIYIFLEYECFCLMLLKISF